MGGRLPKMRSHQPKQCLCTCPVLPCNFAGPKNIPPNFFRYRPCKYYCAPSLFICITKWSQKFREEFRARGACQSNLCVCNFGFAENGWFYMCKISSCIFFWLIIVQILLSGSSIYINTLVALFFGSKTRTVSRLSSKPVVCAYFGLKSVHLWHVKQAFSRCTKPL